MGRLSPDDIRKQSQQAYGQWAEQWREHAKINSDWKMKSMKEFKFMGIGKACLLIANGYSFEKEIETIKNMQGNVDIVVCDKTLGHCLDHGITPNFCILADANVNFEAYCEKWKDQLQDTVLLQNVCGNPVWAKLGNWKDRFFFCNQDILKSELEFSKISGCKNFVPAGTNVSNAMLVVMTQSSNEGRANFFGYDKYILIGYDYCWNDSYYAFDKDGGGKTNYMRHVYAIDDQGDLCYTSSNLLFSVKWMNDYISAFKLPVVQCSKGTVLMLGESQMQDLKTQMTYNYRVEDSVKVKTMVAKVKDFQAKIEQYQKDLNEIAQAHHNYSLATL